MKGNLKHLIWFCPYSTLRFLLLSYKRGNSVSLRKRKKILQKTAKFFLGFRENGSLFKIVPLSKFVKWKLTSQYLFKLPYFGNSIENFILFQSVSSCFFCNFIIILRSYIMSIKPRCRMSWQNIVTVSPGWNEKSTSVLNPLPLTGYVCYINNIDKELILISYSIAFWTFWKTILRS